MFFDKPESQERISDTGALGEPATFLERTKAALDAATDRNVLNASGKLLGDAYKARIEAIRAATGDDLSPFDPMSVTSASTMGGFEPPGEAATQKTPQQKAYEFQRELERLAEKKPEFRDIIAPHKPVHGEVARGVQEREQRSVDAGRNYGGVTGTGPIADFAGGMAAQALDPVNAATLLLGPWGRTGQGAKAILAMGVKQGIANAGVETAMQPLVQDFRRQMGLSYGLSEAATDIAAAGALGFGFDAVGRALARGVQSSLGRKAILDADGKVTGYESAEASAARAKRVEEQRLKAEQLKALQEDGTLAKAMEGDPEAIAKIDPILGLSEDPAVRGAMQARSFVEMEPGELDSIIKQRNLEQALRAAMDADEPPPVIRLEAPSRRPSLSDEMEIPKGTEGNQHFRTIDIDGKPVRLQNIDPKSLTTDAESFQFKTGADARGVTGALGINTTFDPAAAGRVMVFERGDGVMVIVDGHQRLSIARDGDQFQGFVFREADGWTPDEVRAEAALKNIQEGRTGLLDAVRAVREHGSAMEGRLDNDTDFMRQVMALSRLSDSALARVEAGTIEPNMAALVGELVPDQAKHDGVVQALMRANPPTEAAARKIIGREIREPVRSDELSQVMGASIAEPHVIEARTDVLAGVIGTLRGEPGYIGNVETQAVAKVISRLADRPGLVADTLNQAGRAVAEGQPIERAIDATLRRFEQVIADAGVKGLADRPVRLASVSADDPVRLAALSDVSTGRSMRVVLDKLGYYSKALEAAKSLKQAKGTPEQMLAQIKAAGVKDAEIEATGLLNFLGLERGSDGVVRRREGSLEPNRPQTDLTEAGQRDQTPAALGRQPELADHSSIASALSSGAWREASDAEAAMYLAQVLKTSDLEPHVGIRVTEEPLKVGSEAPPSRVWDDGEPTSEMLAGASAIKIKDTSASEIEDALRGASSYDGNYISIITSRYAEVGNDTNELVMSGNRVVASIGRTDRDIHPKIPVWNQPLVIPSERPALAKPITITRDEIVNHLTENRVGVREVMKGAVLPSAETLEKFARINFGRSFSELTPAQQDRLRRDNVDHGASTRWSSYSLDPSNPTYRETVLHLPDTMKQMQQWKVVRENGFTRGIYADEASARRAMQAGDALQQEETVTLGAGFRSGHFSEPNIIGHMMTSMTKHEGRPVYTIDQIQSDWGQKLRDGGVRDEKKIAELKRQFAEAEKAYDAAYAKMPIDAKLSEIQAMPEAQRVGLLRAELQTAEAATPGNPLVNTTDQWVNTTLRRALRQAAEADAEFVAIPHGDTVLSYNPGDEGGMRGFYGSRTSEGIVPKNLRKLLEKIDKDSAKPTLADKLETPSGMKGSGFTLFPLTAKVKKSVMEEGQPLFALKDGDKLTIEQKIQNWESIDKFFQALPKETRRPIGDGLDVIRTTSNNYVNYNVVESGKPLWADNGNSNSLGTFIVKASQRLEVAGVESTNSRLSETLQRRGIGTKVYDLIDNDMKEVGGLSPSPTDQLSGIAKEFWKKRLGYDFTQPVDQKALQDFSDNLESVLREAQQPSPPRLVSDLKDAKAHTEELREAMAPEIKEATDPVTAEATRLAAIRAYHGSPHDFDKFDMGKIGSGEGAQAYGHGLYFAESEGVARSYRDALGNYDNVVKWKGAEPPTPEQNRIIDQLSGFDHFRNRQPDLASVRTDITRAINQEHMSEGMIGFDAERSARRVADLRKQLATLDGMKDLVEIQPPGRLYEVSIKANPEDFLDWDKPLSQQSEKVRALLQHPEVKRQADFFGDPAGEKLTGKSAYGAVTKWNTAGDQRNVPSSQALREAGIPGIRYLDQGSRDAGEGSRNYVVFDDSLIEIVAKDGKPVTPDEKKNILASMREEQAAERAARQQPAMIDPSKPLLYTPDANARMAEIRKEIDRTIQMLPPDVRIRVEDELVFSGLEAPDQRISGLWDGYDRLVYVALSGGDPVRAVRHEVIHALKQSKLLTDSEFNQLYAFAETLKLRNAYGIDAKYRELYSKAYGERGGDYVEMLLREETVAEMFADYSLNGRRFGDVAGGGIIDRLIDKIVMFMKAMRDNLGFIGFKNVNDIFQAIESGEVAARPSPRNPRGGRNPDVVARQIGEAMGASRLASSPLDTGRSMRAEEGQRPSDMINQALATLPEETATAIRGLLRQANIDEAQLGSMLDQLMPMIRSGDQQAIAARVQDMAQQAQQAMPLSYTPFSRELASIRSDMEMTEVIGVCRL